MTNYEKIKSMGSKEIASVLSMLTVFIMKMNGETDIDCKRLVNLWDNWLESEAELDHSQ